VTPEDEIDYITGEIFNQHPEIKAHPEITKRIRIISTAIQGKTLLVCDARSVQYLAKNIPEHSVFALDAFSTFIQGNETVNTDMQKEMAAIRQLAKSRKASPFLIHHRPKPNQFGHQSSFRGAVAIQQPVRFHIMLERVRGGTTLSFEKVSRGLPPEGLTLSFDEERRIFIPLAADRYVKLFGENQVLSTTDVMTRLGLNPANKDDRKTVLNALSHRSKHSGAIEQLSPGRKKQEAMWQLR
jgi:hypothetical protein